MNPCNGYEEKVFDYAEGLLATSFKTDVESHLASCSQCSETVRDIQRVRSQLNSLPVLKTSTDFDILLRARIRMERSLKRRGVLTRPIGIPVYAAAGTIAVLAVLFVLSPISSTLDTRGDQAVREERGMAGGAGTTASVQALSSSPQQVNYPMDTVIPVGGTPLRSDAQSSSLTGPDSLNNRIRPVQHKNYEF